VQTLGLVVKTLHTQPQKQIQVSFKQSCFSYLPIHYHISCK